jgi:hypothetical protein
MTAQSLCGINYINSRKVIMKKKLAFPCQKEAHVECMRVILILLPDILNSRSLFTNNWCSRILAS